MAGLLDGPESRINNELVSLGYVEDPSEEAEAEQEQPIETELDSTCEAQAPQEYEGTEFAEVNRRMSKALLYKQLLNGDLFGDADELADEVNKEVKEFVRDRCMELLGMQGVKPQQQIQIIKEVEVFTEPEVQALKSLANKIITGSSAVQKTAGLPVVQKPTPKPVLKQQTPEPVVVKKAPPKPTLKKREIPQELQKPAISQPVNRPQVAQKTVAKPVRSGQFPQDEDVVEEHGQKFKIKHQETSPDNYSLTDAAAMKKMRDGETMFLKDNTHILRSGNTWIRASKRAATVPKQEGFPTPTPKQLEMYTAQMSGQAASHLNKSRLVNQLLL
jgi:hypothetical protein